MGKTQILAIGYDKSQRASIADLLEDCVITEIPVDIEKMMEPVSLEIDMVICGPVPGSIQLAEVAQLLRQVYQTKKIFLNSSLRQDFDHKLLVRYGFSEVFIENTDLNHFRKAITDCLAQARVEGHRTYFPLKPINVKPGTKLDFDTYIYLPANDRYKEFSKAGEPLDMERAQRLMTHDVGSIYVYEKQLNRFYEYTKHALKDQRDENFSGINAHFSKFPSMVRYFLTNLLSGKDIVTVQKGGDIYKICLELVHTYILKDEFEHWYLLIMNWKGSPFDYYGHIANVALYSATLASALGWESVEDIAVAGLFHSFGLALAPETPMDRPQIEWTEEESAAFFNHPDKAVIFLNTQKIKASEKTKRILHQFYHCFYKPNVQLSQISPEAQLMAIVDRVDLMTSVQPGKKTMTPIEALKSIKQDIEMKKINAVLDMNLLDCLTKLFPDPSNKT